MVHTASRPDCDATSETALKDTSVEVHISLAFSGSIFADVNNQGISPSLPLFHLCIVVCAVPDSFIA